MKKLALLTLTIFVFSANAQIKPYDLLNTNSISTIVYPTFPQFYDNNQVSPIFPHYTIDSISLIFAQNLWIGGKDLSNQLHFAGDRYSGNGVDFFYGPISNNYSGDSIWNKTWKITKAEIEFHKANYWKPSYSAPINIMEFPAHGNTAIGQAANLLPFIDNNSNSIYDPANGDYPSIKGDEAVWFICNDHKALHTETGGNPLKIEIQGMYYAFDCPIDSALNQTIFCEYTILNKSSQNYYETFYGLFTDIDIDYSFNDLSGCDTLLNCYYQYNTSETTINNTDENWVQSVVFLNNKMDRFYSLSNSTNQNINVLYDPRYANEYYYLLKGWINDSTPLIHSFFGLTNNNPVKYMYPGNPLDSTQWSMQNLHVFDSMNVPNDFRGLSSHGPFSFNSGDTIKFEFAMTTARDYGGTNLSSVTLLKQRVQDIITYYNNDSTPCGGSFSDIGPKITFADIKKEFILFPNPSNSRIIIDWGKTSFPYNYEIINLIGQSVAKGTISNSGEKQITVSNLEEGIYILKMQSGDVVQTKKFVRK